RIGGEILIAHGESGDRGSGGLDALDEPGDVRGRALDSPVVVPAHVRRDDGGRVPHEVDEPGVRPTVAQPLPIERVRRGLVDQDLLARRGELALEDAVPEKVFQLLGVQTEEVDRLLRERALDTYAEVAQVKLVRCADLRVAVEDHAQQGLPGTNR